MKRIPCLIQVLIKPVLDRESLPNEVKERISKGVAVEVAKYLNETNHKIQSSLGLVAVSLEAARQEMDVRLWSHVDGLRQSDEADKVEEGNS